jgi:radical SAM superfamily enzyme YgiQ (UPF0313 family)
VRATLISTYELGRQPFGLASAVAWLTEAGAEVDVQDLAICSLESDPISKAGFVGIYVPMHTATRLAEGVIARIRAISPDVPIACFGLYAAMNTDHLIALGATTVIGGEFESSLVEAFLAAARGDTVTGTATSVTERHPFKIPIRSSLPPLDKYARLQTTQGSSRVVGYTEATRGCKHLCRHCPVVPVYGGRFVVVQPGVVLADIRAQVAAGAEHITFGDPDFFNGPTHAMRIAHQLHDEFPNVTYDVTIKVEHLLANLDRLSELRDTGCVLVTSAVESFDEAILERFDKRHTDADFRRVLDEMDRIGLALNPTFVAFTPWTSLDGYLGFLSRIAELGLVGNVSPIQYAIRLLIPAGSLILDLPDMAELVFDAESLTHPWIHPDPRMDELQETILRVATQSDSRSEVFAATWRAARSLSTDDRWSVDPPIDEAVPLATVPYLTEPWYC